MHRNTTKNKNQRTKMLKCTLNYMRHKKCFQSAYFNLLLTKIKLAIEFVKNVHVYLLFAKRIPKLLEPSSAILLWRMCFVNRTFTSIITQCQFITVWYGIISKKIVYLYQELKIKLQYTKGGGRETYTKM